MTEAILFGLAAYILLIPTLLELLRLSAAAFTLYATYRTARRYMTGEDLTPTKETESSTSSGSLASSSSSLSSAGSRSR